MKVIRFVSDAEKEMYLSGAKLLNGTIHSNCRTTSVGFCFAELTDIRNANKWLRKLFYLTTCHWCIEFDASRFATPLNETRGLYADDMQLDRDIMLREFCCTEYSLKTHPYTRIGKCPNLIGMLLGEEIEWQ